MLYAVYTRENGWDRYYNENLLHISAESEEEAKEIYKKNIKTGRKKVYVDEAHKKGVVIFV